MIDAELVFVAVFSQGGVRGHNTGVEDKDIEAGSFGQEGLGGCLDGDEGELVALQEGDWSGRGERLGLGDYFVRRTRIAASEVDMLWTVLDESKDGLLAETIRT